jgi:hypothetical protein
MSPSELPTAKMSKIWGRCYDHNFLRFLTIFCKKFGVFLKNQCYDQNFAQFSFVLSQKRQFFRRNCRRKYFKKIITSVPDQIVLTQGYF